MTTPRKTITPEKVREHLLFSPETGEFRRRTGQYAGQIAGAFCALGYRRVFVDGRSFYAHRLAWLYVHGIAPTELDHINGDRSDNRICNLRPASRIQNIANKAVRNVHGLKGVRRRPRKGSDRWAAYIRRNGRGERLGTFDTIEEAAGAYAKAARDLYGDFALV